MINLAIKRETDSLPHSFASWANQHWLGDAVGTDLYFNPHVEHDTGEQNVLEDW